MNYKNCLDPSGHAAANKTHRELFQIRLVALVFVSISYQWTHSIESVDYRWNNVALGGGGYVTGIVIHPTEPDLIYIRTDVGGAYRWDAVERRWIPLTDWIPFEESNLFGIDGIAIAPSNPDVLYLSAGKYPTASPSGVLKSVDRGQTWTMTKLQKPAGANRPYRWAGECIAVDPLDENRVVCGTRLDGLWTSDDGGETWRPVADVPPGNKEIGIRTVLFDPSLTNRHGTLSVYAGVFGEGVYHSRDGGIRWNRVLNGPSEPQRMAIDREGALYVSSTNGVYQYKHGIWTDITPVQNKEYCGISVSPTDQNVLVCSERFNGFWNPIYLSVDQGKTWKNVLENDVRRFQVPWWPKRHFSSSTACATFDPLYDYKVWFVDWYGIWYTPDITQTPCHWFNEEQGHEEMVAFDLISPPRGAYLLTAIADNNGTRHIDLDEYPPSRFDNPSVQSTTGIDYCEANPNIVVRVGSRNNGEEGAGGISFDNGQTWTPFPETDFPMNGRIAISASDPNILVVLPINDSPKWSRDGGNTWQESSGAPPGGIGNFWHKAQPLASDRVNGNLFYYFEGGNLYRSVDGGNTWAKTASFPREIPGFLTIIKTAPDREGEIWISLGHNGLFRSSDAGLTFKKVDGVSWSRLAAFGKPDDLLYGDAREDAGETPSAQVSGKRREHSLVPTVFVYGAIQDVTGIFRSSDLGSSWVRINDDKHPLGNSPECMAGDRRVFGRVYIGTNGRGIFYGEPAGIHKE